ncbi:MAG: nicotinate-nucleotide adenylyltransferase [Oscillatoria sp. PMC 1051.18]|nr:nicotinate-nucleotide adenylyltransferase [Oscillatoria sp. PMC 1050.18]MEC5028317.1 nicotinate-nucleotide adenylyltransferase [Oscillatoria sp. PMC 1051.18]
MSRIALFGTSADPPTAAHQAIIRWLGEHYDRVAVWASDNPMKSHQTPLSHRMRMLRLLITDIDSEVKNIKLHEELSNPRSLHTVRKAQEMWGKENEFTLVVGSDLIAQMPKWYQIAELLAQVKVLVVPRQGYTIADEDLEEVRNLGGNCEIADFQAPPVSSTAYREQGDTNIITQPVEDYIQQEHLYLCHNQAQTR